MSLGQRIRMARKERGLTQKELADMVGVSDSAIRLYELDKRRPSSKHVPLLADALDVAPELLKDRGIESARDVLEVLLQMNEAGFGLYPVETDDGMAIAIDDAAPHAPKLDVALRAWKKVIDRAKGEEGNVDYFAWRMTRG